MRKFNVNVNGNSYVVEVEEIGAAETAPAGGTALKCPMPGKILKSLVKDGDKVTKNQKVLVLEAMKMENDIVAPTDGVISLLVKEGDDVVSQQDLAVIK